MKRALLTTAALLLLVGTASARTQEGPPEAVQEPPARETPWDPDDPGAACRRVPVPCSEEERIKHPGRLICGHQRRGNCRT